MLWVELISCKVLFINFLLIENSRNDSKITTYCRKVILNTDFYTLNCFLCSEMFIYSILNGNNFDGKRKHEEDL